MPTIEIPALADPTPRLVELTRDLVLIPSTAGRPYERSRCFQLIAQHLEAVPQTTIRRFESAGFESLVATPQGVDTPEVLMVGHLDVIEHGDVSHYRSELLDGRITGPGTGDMKGQVAIMIELYRALQESRPGLSIGLAVTSDEEIGGENGVGYLFGEAGLRCGIALVPDGGSPTEVTVEEKGILHLSMRVEGREIHAARPWLAPNAVLELSRAITRVATRFERLRGGVPVAGDHWYPTFSPTIVGTSNETVNCLPGDAVARADIRFPPPHRLAEVVDIVRREAGESVTVEVLVGAEPTLLKPDPLFFEVAKSVGGHELSPIRASGGSDARFIAEAGIPVILSRPSVGNLHGLDEWIDIASMTAFFHTYSAYILRRLAGA